MPDVSDEGDIETVGGRVGLCVVGFAEGCAPTIASSANKAMRFILLLLEFNFMSRELSRELDANDNESDEGINVVYNVVYYWAQGRYLFCAS